MLRSSQPAPGQGAAVQVREVTLAGWRLAADGGAQALVSTGPDSGQPDRRGSREVRAARAGWTIVLTAC